MPHSKGRSACEPGWLATGLVLGFWFLVCVFRPVLFFLEFFFESGFPRILFHVIIF